MIYYLFQFDLFGIKLGSNLEGDLFSEYESYIIPACLNHYTSDYWKDLKIMIFSFLIHFYFIF